MDLIDMFRFIAALTHGTQSDASMDWVPVDTSLPQIERPGFSGSQM